MQLHLAVTEWNDAAFQGVIESPQNRRDVMQASLAEFDCVLVEWYYSPTEQRSYQLIRGDIHEITAHTMIARASGAFNHISFRPLFTAEEMHSAMVKANSLSTKFDAPNRDEIDSMLLDE